MTEEEPKLEKKEEDSGEVSDGKTYATDSKHPEEVKAALARLKKKAKGKSCRQPSARQRIGRAVSANPEPQLK